MDSLAYQITVRSVRECLGTLPIGSNALDYAYDEALKRVKSRELPSRELAVKTLSWIVYAQRPLHFSQVQHALAIEIGKKDLDPENLNDIGTIISTCAGLVMVNERRIRLLHYTTQGYLVRTGPYHLPNAHQINASSCRTYLQFNDFAHGVPYQHEGVLSDSTNLYSINRSHCRDRIRGIHFFGTL